MQALIDATLKCQAQNSPRSAVPVRFSNAAAPPLLCSVCGDPAQSRCVKCMAALYCSQRCQAAHWGVHRGPCKVDRRNTAEAEAVYAIDHKCRHGGPDIENDPPLMASLQAAMGAIAALPPRGAPAELAYFCSFARAKPPHPQLHRILLSCAVDAVADNNLGNARMFGRFGAFCRAVCRRGALLGELEAGLAALGGGGGSGGGSGGGGGSDEHLQALAEEVAALASHTGLLAALRRHITCRCLAPRSASALPLVELPQGSEAAQDGAGAAAAGAGEGEGAAAAAAAAPEPAPAAEATPVEAMSIKQLKAALAERGVSTVGMAEKQDLQEALRNALK